MIDIRSRPRIFVLIALIAMLIASGLPAFAQSNCDPAIHHLRAGNEFYAAGNFQAAYASFTCVLALYPADAYPELYADALNMRGNSLREQGDWQGALSEYTQAIAIVDDFALAYNNRGWAYFNLNDYDAALQDYNTAIFYDDTLAYAYNNRGLIHQFRSELRAAAEDFERAIALGLDPAAWAEYNLGLVHLVESRQGNTLVPADAESVTDVEDTLDNLLLAGEMAHEDGRWRDTITAMTDAIALDANADRAYYLRGRAHIALDDPQVAFADFDRLVMLRPGFEYGYWERAIAYVELGDFARAQADAQQAALMNPGHINNFIVRGTIASLQGDAASAGAEFLGVMLCGERERLQHGMAAIGESLTLAMTEGRVYEVTFEAEAG